MSKVPLLSEASDQELAAIKGICLDIDDTLSTEGKISPEAYKALWDLQNAGLAVVPVTGRPAGWCDHIARFWPVNAVIGENGAFVFYMKDGKLNRFDVLGEEKSKEARDKLCGLGAAIKKEFPHTQFASDQNYREYDLAIDFCEDVPAWKDEDVKKLTEFCHKQGAHAKISSIHVNTWFGDYDKQSAFKAWIDKGAPGLNSIPNHQEWIYIGDSPNDEPAFAFFKYSVGVANLAKYLPDLKTAPTWLTKKESGAGFVELAERLIQKIEMY